MSKSNKINRRYKGRNYKNIYNKRTIISSKEVTFFLGFFFFFFFWLSVCTTCLRVIVFSHITIEHKEDLY